MPAFVSERGETVLTYRELGRASDALASRLRFLAPGSLIAAALPNGVAFAVTALAAWKLGAVVAPISSAAPAPERARLIDRLQPRVLVIGESAQCPPTAVATVVWPRSERPTPEIVERVTACAEPATGPGIVPSPDDALILFTSGSTGEPKGVVLSRDNVEAGVLSVLRTYGLTAADRTVTLLPWTHGHGLIGVLLSTLSAGASIVLGTHRTGVRAVETLRHAVGVTWVSMVPSQLTILCAQAEMSGPTPTWRFIRTASSPLSQRVASEAERLFACPVSEAYGMTETAHQAAANAPTFAERRLGSVGAASDLRFRYGRPFAAGHELEVSGRAVFRGYLRDPEATRSALQAGWYRTQDVGRLDGEGRIMLLGRLSEHINRGGSKVSPMEVEAALSQHPDVAASLVVGLPHPVLGEEVAALVRLRADAHLSQDALTEHCAAHLSSAKRPRVIRFVAEIPCLPNGKPSRQLARRLLSDAESG